MDSVTTTVIAIIVCGAITIAGMFSYSRGQSQCRIEAVEVGVAEWVVVSPSGETEFRWKTPEQQERKDAEP